MNSNLLCNSRIQTPVNWIRFNGVDAAFIGPAQNSRADILQGLGKSMGPTLGVEVPVTPDIVGWCVVDWASKLKRVFETEL
jgi:hypothetical protein